MHTRTIISLVALVALVGVWYLLRPTGDEVPISNGPASGTGPNAEVVSESISEEVARSWVEDSAPTYVFDGMDLSLAETLYPDIADCASCYQFVYTFNSRAAGYGDRSDMMLAQVITSHEIVVTVENGKVVSAVTDGVFDEMSGTTLTALEGDAGEVP